jgi:hypothetical protein
MQKPPDDPDHPIRNYKYIFESRDTNATEEVMITMHRNVYELALKRYKRNKDDDMLKCTVYGLNGEYSETIHPICDFYDDGSNKTTSSTDVNTYIDHTGQGFMEDFVIKYAYCVEPNVLRFKGEEGELIITNYLLNVYESLSLSDEAKYPELAKFFDGDPDEMYQGDHVTGSDLLYCEFIPKSDHHPICLEVEKFVEETSKQVAMKDIYIDGVIMAQAHINVIESARNTHPELFTNIKMISIPDTFCNVLIFYDSCSKDIKVAMNDAYKSVQVTKRVKIF